MNVFFRLICGSIIFFSVLFAQNKKEFAEYLIKNQDYFRAITVYKELYFNSKFPEEKTEFLYKIMSSYHNSNKYELSNSYASFLLSNFKLDNIQNEKVLLYKGINSYLLGNFDDASNSFNDAKGLNVTSLPNYFLGLSYIQNSNWKEAHQIYSKIENEYNGTEIGFCASHLAKKCLNYNVIPKKSPFVAALLSAILPGSGQIYSGHYYDGLQAFLYCAVTGFAAYSAYRYDKHFNTNYVTTYVSIPVAAAFYLANILGAKITANYYNAKMYNNYINSFQELVFSISID